MKLIRPYVIVMLLGLCSFTLQKDKPFIIKKAHDNFAVDNLGNMFFTRESEILKYLANGNYYNRYSNLKLGEISSIDATNALRIILFYKDQQQILFLDNQLSQKSDPVSLEQLGYEQTELVCGSANSGFWIYTKSNNELIRFDNNLKKISATGNLKPILQADLKPNFMIEHNGNVYLNCPEQGIYVFDIFGTFSKIISIKDLKNLQVSDDIIYYPKKNKVCSYNFKLFEEVCDSFPVQKINQAYFYKNKVYLSNKDTLFVY